MQIYLLNILKTKMISKIYTLSELSAIVAKHECLDMSQKWHVNIHFYGDEDHYIFKFKEKKSGK